MRPRGGGKGDSFPNSPGGPLQRKPMGSTGSRLGTKRYCFSGLRDLEEHKELEEPARKISKLMTDTKDLAKTCPWGDTHGPLELQITSSQLHPACALGKG